MSFGALSELSRRWRDAFRASGAHPGDRICIFIEKHFDMVAALLGAMAAGAIAVPANPQFKPAQVGHILTDCQAAILVTSAARLKSLRQLPGLPQTILCDAAPLPAEPGVASIGQFAAAPPSPDARAIDHDPAAILDTSGSTGLPKGIVLSHRNLFAGAQSVNGYLDHGPEDVILSVLPLSFDAGLGQLTMALDAGAKLVLVNYLAAAEVASLADRHGATAPAGPCASSPIPAAT